ncbi:MAG: hypothetical protein QOG67_981 [Verrucomicrobiota bacterium]|jgi:hypothetical protein
MKKLINYTSILLFATVALAIAAPDKEKITARENAAWQAYKDKKADVFRKMVADDYRAVYADGNYTVDKEIKSLNEMDLKSFSLSDFDIVATDPDTVIVAYKATIQGTSGGKDVSGTYNCASVWQKHKDAWHVMLHTNVAEQKPSDAAAPATQSPPG